MATTRTRRNRGSGLTQLIIAQIGVGCGINSLSDEELRQLWKDYGQAVTEHWQRTYGDKETFVGMLAREEGWDIKRNTKRKEIK